MEAAPTDVKATLDSLMKERDSLLSRIAALDDAIRSLAVLAGPTAEPILSRRPIGRSEEELLDALAEIISDGKGYLLQDLENEVKSLGFRFPEGKSVKRAINFRMLSLLKSGRAEKRGDLWFVAKK